MSLNFKFWINAVVVKRLAQKSKNCGHLQFIQADYSLAKDIAKHG